MSKNDIGNTDPFMKYKKRNHDRFLVLINRVPSKAQGSL